jgi:hypothetical protein
MATAPNPFTGHEGAVRAIAVFPEGGRFVTGGDDAKIRLWDLRTRQLLAFHEEHEDQVLAVATTEDERVVSCGQAATVVWDIASRVASSTPHHTRVTEAAVSPRGDLVAAIDLEQTILRPTDGRGLSSGHRRVDSIAVTTNGQIITAGVEPLVRVTDWSGNELGRLNGRVPGDVAVAGSADSMRIVYVTPEGVWYWNRRQTVRPVQLTGCEDAVTLAVTPDGRQVIAGGFSGGIWAWNLDDPRAEPIRMRGHDKPVRSFAVTPDCKLLISGAEDGTIRIWDLTTAAEYPTDRTPRPQPGLASDQESALDLLGFTEDVDSMAALIADRETEPPLAIALLGRWGSGKSSFMRQLQDRVARLAEQGHHNPTRSVFATAVRQVRFDAWHYNDDHLWVGMIEHLFTGLAEPAPDAAGVRAERDALRQKLRDLEELADPKARATRRLRARLRLLLASLAPWRGRIALAGTAVVLLGAVTGLTWWLSGDNVVTWVFGVLTAAAASSIVDRIIMAWRAVRGLAGRRAPDLDQTVRVTRMQLARLDAAQRLALVIEDARSGGYDQYRGLLGQVHADLRRLSDSARQAFAEWGEADPAGKPPLERVILYIDDLDRCSPRKVVDVLAAVHLLLALPLFVVVVAVDPRWLRRCLEQYHSELFGGRADETGGATPLDYLDKIFQVVFALRPMGNEADRFVAALVRTAVASPLPRGPATDGPGTGALGNEPTPAGGTQVTPPPLVQPPNPQPEQLRLRADELRSIQRLRPLLETPRAVKRFVNLYRLVRAAIADNELDDFIGADGAGPYQAVLVLLAVLVSAPEACRTLAAALREPNREGSIATLVQELASAEQSSQARDVWTRLLDVMRDGDPLHDSLSTYRGWAGTIARFSFETWDLTEPR